MAPTLTTMARRTSAALRDRPPPPPWLGARPSPAALQGPARVAIGSPRRKPARRAGRSGRVSGARRLAGRRALLLRVRVRVRARARARVRVRVRVGEPSVVIEQPLLTLALTLTLTPNPDRSNRAASSASRRPRRAPRAPPRPARGSPRSGALRWSGRVAARPAREIKGDTKGDQGRYREICTAHVASHVSPYLRHISATSRLYLPYISPISRLLGRAAHVARGHTVRVVVGLLPDGRHEVDLARGRVLGVGVGC